MTMQPGLKTSKIKAQIDTKCLC